MRNQTEKHASTKTPSVTRQREEETGKDFLQGRETADAKRANVFGDGNYNPFGARNANRSILFEVVVKYRFFEGTIDDYCELHSFWVKTWKDTPDGPRAEPFINGEDFCAYHEDQWRDWADLLREAVRRIRDARHMHIAFEPRLVGAPNTD
jgi:hypothetical protein